MAEVIPPRNAFTTVGCIQDGDMFVVDNTLYRMFQGRVMLVQITEYSCSDCQQMPSAQMVIRLSE
jgi:hypothetical protein